MKRDKKTISIIALLGIVFAVSALPKTNAQGVHERLIEIPAARPRQQPVACRCERAG